MSFVGISNVAQTIMPHTSNIGYQVRGAYRIETAVPDDRRIDYWYRDMFQPLISTLGIDLAIRMADYYLAFPAYTKALELDKLTELYGNKGFEAVKNYSYKDMGKAGLMQQVRERIIHASKGGSYDSIPRLFEQMDLPGMPEETKKEGQVVAHHLKRRLNYTQYIDDVLLPGKKLTEKEAGILKKALQETQEALAKGTLKEVKTSQIKKLTGEFSEKLLPYLKEGLQSKEVIHQLKRIKNLNFWPQMLGNVLYSFIIVGVLASAIDVKKIQPWQEKLVKQGYDSNIIMKPAYLSFLPAIGVFAAVHKSKAMKKLGYLKHFTATWTAALATYTLLTFLWTKHRIKNTKPNPPAPEKDRTIPKGFVEAPLQHPAFYNAFYKAR